MGIKLDDVKKALGDLEAGLKSDAVVKASEQDLDQPEGSDLDAGHMGNKMSDDAPAPVKGKKAKKSETEAEEDDEMNITKAMEVLEDAGYSVTEEDESFSKGLPEEVQTKIEVSDFLKSLVDHTGEVIGDLRGQLAKSECSQIEFNKSLAEGLEEIQESQAKVGVVLKAICERIGIIEAAPAYAPKAETDVTKSASQPAERQFESALKGDGQEPMFKSLSANPMIAKSQLAEAMCDLVRKGEASDMDVIGFESSGHIRPEVVTKLRTVLN